MTQLRFSGQRPPRSRALMFTVGFLLVGFVLLTTLSTLLTERWWYQSVGFSSVFSTMLGTRVLLFGLFGGLMALTVATSMLVAYRTRPIFAPESIEQNNLDRYRSAVTPIRRWLVIVISGLMGAFAGASAMSQWRSFLMWRNATDFGTTDPYFDRDIGWYVFSLPWWHYLVDFVIAACIVSLMAALVVHYLYGGIRLQAITERISRPAVAHLSILLGVLVLAKGVDYWLDRFDILNGSGGLLDGMGYTDQNAVLPAKNILMGIAVICAVLFFVNVWRRTWMLPTVGLALFALSAILLGMIWPGVVQQFQVNPSEADREEPYLAANIEATRAAYGLDDVTISPYAAQAGGASLAEISTATSNVPVLDPQVVRQTFEQNQQITGYYSVADVLDADRYEIEGTDRALVLGVRELNQAGINAANQNWSNLRTVYTHGYGMIAAYANQKNANGVDVRGENIGGIWAEGSLPPKGALTDQGPIENRIYFGEKSPDYSIVGKLPGGPDVEFDLPLGSETEQGSTTTYDGTAGVSVGSTMKQLLYAVKFSDPNILLGSRVNANSKILYDRQPAQRVQKVAPWLSVDSDAMPAVVDGRIVWILDGYTTTDRYPQADKNSYREMTNDALVDNTQFQALPTDEINYIRNAVKATVDAYDGTVTLYAWDETDPMLQTWMKAFPGTVKPKTDMSAQLLEHVRYPEDMFKVQRYQFARYHVTDASDFYEGNDRWSVPEDPYTEGKLQAPYRLFAQPQSDDPQAPDADPVWSMTSVYVPNNRANLASFVSVNSDGASPDYGKIQVLRSPGENVSGPGQVANTFSNDPTARGELLRYSQSGSRVIYGNLLTLPVDGGLLYVQPVYVVKDGEGSYPILQHVIASFGGQEVGFGNSLTAALASLLKTTVPTPPTTPPGNGQNPPAAGNLNAQVRNLLNQADAAFKAADAAFAKGDTVTWAREMERGRNLITQAVNLAR